MSAQLTRAVIHLNHLRSNLKLVRSLIPKGTLICPAVKANAYGHGAVRISHCLKEEGVSHLAVARVSEGQELRLAGIEGPILLFGHCLPGELELMIRFDLTPMAGDLLYIRRLEEEAARQKKVLSLHLKVDTGMGRIGCPPEEALDLVRYIQKSPWLKQEGLCTHFPVGDSPKKGDRDFTESQVKQLLDCAEEIRGEGLDPGILHGANSGGIILHPASHLQMVRPGIILYGYRPDSGIEPLEGLKPVMELEAPVMFLKKVEKGQTLSYGRTWTAEESRYIATLPMGYADGYFRGLSNGAPVWIAGHNYPVAGTVCMDQLMVDLGREKGVELHDRAVFFGPTEGAPDAEQLAERLGTIAYEITCAVSSRVPRIYRD